MMFKNKVQFTILLALVFICVLQTATAQKDFRPAYIIKAPSDTLYGQVAYRGDMKMSKACTFRKDKNSEAVVYSPNDILAFRFINGKSYAAREVNGKKVFLEFLIHGKIDIFYYRDQKGDHYLIAKEGFPLTELAYEEKVVTNVETRHPDVHINNYLYRSTQYMGILKTYMEDAPDLYETIDKIRKPSLDNLIALGKKYHVMVDSNTKAIIYEKNLPGMKVAVEPIFGGVSFYHLPNFTDKNYFQFGGLLSFLPRKGGQLSFRTGFVSTNLLKEGEKINFTKIPVQVQYVYPKGFIRPKLVIGPNFYPQYKPHTTSFGGGVDIKITDKVFGTINGEVEWFKVIPRFPNSLVSNSLNVGIKVHLY